MKTGAEGGGVAGADSGRQSAHDLGGRRGFGRIDRSQTALFAGEWEQSVFGMTLACGMLGRWNLDQSRFAREQMAPAEYLAGSYYEHWLHGLELLLVEHGLLSRAELQSGQAAIGTAAADPARPQAVAAQRVPGILAKGAPTLLSAPGAPRFANGARVRVRKAAARSRQAHNHTHTRAPGYTQGHAGVVVGHHGAHIFPDRHAADGGKQPQHLYNIRFTAEELWGANRDGKREGRGESNAAVYVDLFEPYLESAHDGP